MDSSRLISRIQSSPLWCSNSLSHEGPENEAPGLDAVWYFRTFRNALGPSPTIDDCFSDYLVEGSRLLRSPNMVFDEAWYRRQYLEVEEAVRVGRFRSGWHHYLEAGVKLSFNPNYWFSENWYRRQHPEVATGLRSGSLLCGFEHFLSEGLYQGFSPSVYFNVPWYQRQYLAQQESADRRSPIAHYLLCRPDTRPCPTPLFQPDWYSRQYLVQNESCYSSFEHYMLVGRELGYSPSPHFNEQAYRTKYPEATESIGKGVYATGLEHYLVEGALDGLTASRHLEWSGVDYSVPEFFESYEESILLNVRQIAEFRELLQDL